MTSGETLLKLSDYPFAYSLIGLLATSSGFDLTQHHVIYLGLAGGLGTLLTILDPFGWLVRKNMRRKLTSSDDYDAKSLHYEKGYAIQAINTKSIGAEIDKIVGILYFAVTAGVFTILIVLSPAFDKNFIISDKNGVTMCDLDCIRSVTAYVSSPIDAVLIIVGITRWRELFDKVTVAGMHQFAISSEYPTINSVENMTRAVDQNDWETAKKWGQKIEHEIKNKNAKKEIIIKSAENIYQPLHQESVLIDSACKNAIQAKHHYGISAPKWAEMKSKSLQQMIDEPDLILSIDSFYNKINEFNNLIIACNRKIASTISKKMTEIYGKEIANVRYWITQDYDSRESDLIGCIEFNILPREFYGENASFLQLDIGYRLVDGSAQTTTTKNLSDLELFDKAWKLISKDLSNDSDIQKLQNLFQIISDENLKLMSKYSEKIQNQWKV